MASVFNSHPHIERLALVVGIAAFVVLLFDASYASMWDLWQTSDHRHGLLVFPISMFLVWRLRHRLTGFALAPAFRGLLLVVPLAGAWLIARLAGIQAAEHLLVLLMIPAAVAALAGSGIAGKILFPLLFLLLAVPLGDALVPYLMVVTADLSAGLLKLSGFPVFRDGQYISLPGGEFVVADVCSGLNYLLTGIMVSLLFGYLTYSSARKRLIIVAATVVILVVANGVRAYIVMAVASMSNMQYLGGRDHIYFGWLMFGVIIMAILWIGAKYADAEEDLAPAATDADSPRPVKSALPLIAALGLVMLAVTLKPLEADVGEAGTVVAVAAALIVFAFFLLRRKGADVASDPARPEAGASPVGWRRASVAIATLAILVLTPRFAAEIESRAIDTAEVPDLQALASCAESGPWRSDWQPLFHNPDLEHSATLSCGENSVGIYVAAYASALQGRELVSSAHHVVPDRFDRFSSASSYSIAARAGTHYRVAETVIDSPGYRALVWHWYEIDGLVASGPGAAKAYQVWALLRGRPAGGRVVVIQMTMHDEIQRTRDALETVAGSLVDSDPM